MGRVSEHAFFQRRHADDNWHMKSYSTSLTVMKIRIETTMRYHLIPAGMAILKKTRNNKRWCDVEKREPPILSVGM